MPLFLYFVSATASTRRHDYHHLHCHRRRRRRRIVDEIEFPRIWFSLYTFTHKYICFFSPVRALCHFMYVYSLRRLYILIYYFSARILLLLLFFSSIVFAIRWAGVLCCVCVWISCRFPIYVREDVRAKLSNRTSNKKYLIL